VDSEVGTPRPGGESSVEDGEARDTGVGEEPGREPVLAPRTHAVEEHDQAARRERGARQRGDRRGGVRYGAGQDRVLERGEIEGMGLRDM
jgi:hypothetical protein